MSLAARQLMGVALCRSILQFPPAVAMRRADIVKWLGPSLQRYVCGKKST